MQSLANMEKQTDQFKSKEDMGKFLPNYLFKAQFLGCHGTSQKSSIAGRRKYASFCFHTVMTMSMSHQVHNKCKDDMAKWSNLATPFSSSLYFIRGRYGEHALLQTCIKYFGLEWTLT